MSQGDLPCLLCPAGLADSSCFPDARACTFGPGDQCDSILLVVYANHEMVMWDIQDLAKVCSLKPSPGELTELSKECEHNSSTSAWTVTCDLREQEHVSCNLLARGPTVVLSAMCFPQMQPVRSFAAHRGGIWDLCSFVAPSTSLDMTDSVEGSFCCATCGTDGSIQVWDFGSVDDTLHPLCSVAAGKCGAGLLTLGCAASIITLSNRASALESWLQSRWQLSLSALRSTILHDVWHVRRLAKRSGQQS